jgi:hypothetical protein
VYAREREKERERIEQMVQEKMYLAYEQALQDVLRVLEYDIESVTKIGVNGCKEIFEGKAAQKFISDQIMRTIQKELRDKHLRK